MSTTDDAETTTIAKVAADRAQALRRQASALSSEALAPLRKALQIRAGELELASAVLLEEKTSPERHLQAIA
jgi:hypothetical protein